MSQLQRGWSTACIGDLCTLVNGRAFKPTDWTIDGLPIIRIQNLNNPNAPFNRYSREVDPRFYVSTGELLFAWSGTPGTSFGAHIWRGGPAVLNQHIFRVLFDERVITKEFFRLAINQKLDELIGKAHGGVGLAHVTKGKFEATEILVPPLAEQHRIVAKLDAIFARSRAVKASLKRVLEVIELQRQSILIAALSGNLVDTETSLPFGASEEGSPSSGAGLPLSWRRIEVGAIAEVQLGRQRSPDNHSGAFMRPYLRAANITWAGLDLSDVKTMNFRPDEMGTFALRPGDVLLSEASGSASEVGKPAIWRGEIADCCFQNTLIRIRSRGPMPEYLHLHFLSDALTGRFSAASRGIGIHHLGAKALSNWKIALPPLDEQARVVKTAERALKIVDSLERKVNTLLVKCDSFERAALSSAFRGDLVPQDPNDEPASVLLERIRAERAASQPVKSKRGASTSAPARTRRSKGAP